jgi:uncharacterized protein with HEPN domain
MTRSDDLRLLDIIDAAERIARLESRGRDAYDEDEAIQPAIERLLEIIGESANALAKDTCGEIREVEWADLRRLRIVLAHHYHRVDSEQVWIMATVNIPELLAQIRQARPSL